MRSLLLLAAALAGTTPLFAQATMFRGGPGHTGVADSSPGRFGGVRWRVPTDGPVRSSPVVFDGTVYVGSSDGGVCAIDVASGDVRWRAELRSPVTASPAVTRALVIVGARDGRFVALDRATGRVRWTVRSGPDLPLPWGGESGDRWTASPTIAGTTVYLAGGDGVLRAADVATGRVRWSALANGRVRGSPAVAGGMVVVGDAVGYLYGFDAATGAERWRFETFGVTLRSDTFGYDRRLIQASPAIDSSTVYVGARDGFLYAVDLATGRERWRFDHRISWVNTSPAVDGGRVFAGSSDGQFVHAVDAATGRELWRTTTGLTWSSPTVSGAVLYSADGAGRLYAHDKATGTVLWRWRAGAGIFSSPTVAGGTLYVGSDDGGVYALDVSAPRPLLRALFWDSAYVRATTYAAHAQVREWFEGRDYEVLGGAALARFLAERVTDRAPRVVVLGTDHLPTAVLGDGTAASLLRRYLEAGGTIVAPGIPPLLLPRDSATGRFGLGSINRPAAQRLLGVAFTRGMFDRDGTSRITAAGRRLGLLPNWLSSWSADPESVTDTLALDEMGNASAWRRRYGGGPGTGFVRVPAVTTGTGSLVNPLVLQLAAELRPRS